MGDNAELKKEDPPLNNEVLEKADIELKKEKTRKISIVEGSFASVMSGAGDSYITPYAIELKANNAQVGAITSLAGILGPLAQIFGSKLIEKYPRKKIVFVAVILQALMWIAILGLGFIFLKYGESIYLIPLLIASYILYAIFGSLGGPAWFSMMGDVVPENSRGSYFSKRNRITGFVAIASTLLASLLLYYTKLGGIIIYGFLVLFAISSIARFISGILINKYYEPPIKLSKEYYFSFWQFIKKAPSNNFGRFTIYIALINLSVNIAGPFFAVYMWKDLGFNPIWFTLVNISAGLFSILLVPIWGRFADKYGNREMLKIGSIFISIIPFLWLFSGNPLYLILVPQLISGIGWAAFNLAASNFIYDAVTVERRAICVAYYSVLSGLGVFIGAIAGGLIAEYSNITFINIFFFIFIVSGIFRALFSIIMIPRIREVRTTISKDRPNPLNYLKEIRPIHGSIALLTHPFSTIKLLGHKIHVTKN